MSAPSLVPESSPPPQPRTHIQGCRREACSTSWSRSAPPAQAAATSAPPLTPAMPATATPSRSRARSTPAWAAAWAPPPESARYSGFTLSGRAGVDLLQAHDVQRRARAGPGSPAPWPRSR